MSRRIHSRTLCSSATTARCAGLFRASSSLRRRTRHLRRAGGGSEHGPAIARRIVLGLPTRFTRWGLRSDQGCDREREIAHTRVAVERRAATERRDGREPVVIAEADGDERSAAFTDLYRIAADNAAIAGALLRIDGPSAPTDRRRRSEGLSALAAGRSECRDAGGVRRGGA